MANGIRRTVRPLLLLLAAGGLGFGLVPQPAFSEQVQVVNLESGRCMDVAGWSRENGANIQLYSCNGGGNQIFHRHQARGGMRLVATHSDKCVEIAGGSIRDSANVQQYDCHGEPNQIFALEGQQLRATQSRKCLGVLPPEGRDGANVVQQTCDRRRGQAWRLEAPRPRR